MHGGRPLPNQILDHTYHPNPRTSHAKLIRRFGGTIPRFTLSQKEGGNTSRYSVVLTGYCTTGLGNGGEANEAAIKCKGGYFGLEQPTDKTICFYLASTTIATTVRYSTCKKR